MATKAEILKKHKMTEQEFYQKYPTQESYMKEFGEGGSIHIKPENRGKFTAYKQRTGKTTEEALHSPDPHVRQMANFARNAAKWKHADGGMMKSSRITPEITRLDNGGQMNYYNNQINKENALATGLLQTGLGLAGTAIGGPAGGMVGSSLGSAVGGLFEKGGPLTKYNGLKHSEGGIALGNTGNEVEDKETRIGDFIFSEKLKASKNTSFADMSKKIEKQTVGRRDNDKISKTTFDRKIGALAEKQEASKAVNSMSNTTNKFEGGTNNLSGKNPYSNPYRDNSYLQPYTYNSKPAFPVEQPNNSTFNNASNSFTKSLNTIKKPGKFSSPEGLTEDEYSQNYGNNGKQRGTSDDLLRNQSDPNFIPKPLNRIMPNSIQNPGLGKMPNYSPLNPDGSLSVKQPFKDKAGNKLYYNFNGKEYNPESKYVEPITKNPATKDKKQMDLSWVNPALQMGLSSLGNYKPLTVKNYQMKPDLLDSTQAKKENRDMFSSVNSDLATSGLTGGQYLASRMGTASQAAGENAKIDNAYRSANVGIKNQFRQFNNATDKEVQELNAREIDASKTARQVRNQNMAGIIGGYGQDRGRQEAVIPEGHEAIYDKYGRIKSFRKISTGETIPVK